MELKDFVKRVIVDLDQAISEANIETHRKIKFNGARENKNAVEFDIAVTAETANTGEGGGVIKVWGIGTIGGEASTVQRSSTVSRISFSVDVSELTRSEEEQDRLRIESQFRELNNNPGR